MIQDPEKDSKEKSAREQKERFDAACNVAAERREVNRELREQYRSSPELGNALRADLVTDLLRVYNHEDNPYKGFAASRKRYRQLGHYPEIIVEDFFGNHEEFLRAAGLGDLRNTTRVRNRGALLHTHQRIAEYAERELKPYHGAFQKALDKDTIRVAVGSDFHSLWCDRFALRVMTDVVGWTAPDYVVLNGDVVDFPKISRHRQLPGHFHLNLRQEIAFAREQIIRPFRMAAPDANMLMVIGNHEARLVNYIADTSSHLAALSVFDAQGNEIEVNFQSLFGLEEFRCGLVCRQNFLAPTAGDRKRDQADNWVVIGDAFVATHGTSCAKFAAAEEMNRFRMSGTSGHTHRPQIVTDNALGTGALSWTSTPMMASFAVGKEYMPNPSCWNMGFAMFTIHKPTRTVVPELVLVNEEFACYAGRTWRPTDEERAHRRSLWTGEISVHAPRS